MGFGIIGFVLVIVANVFVWKSFARLGKQPARALPDGSGRVMVHSNLDKGIALILAALLVGGFVAGILRALQINSWGLAVYVIVLAVPLGWACALYVRKQRNIVELTETGLTWRRGSMATTIAWSEVSGFSEAPSAMAWIVRARDGRTLRVDKLLVGVPTTFLEYLKAHLSASLYDTAFAYVRPIAAQRARERRRDAPGVSK